MTAVIVTLATVGAAAPAAEAAFVGKDDARSYLLRVVPAAAPGVLLGDERGAFFRTGKLWVQRAERCRRRSNVDVTCRFTARLEPDAEHRAQNWWPIDCRGTLLVGLNDGARLQATQRDYACRTIRS